MRRSARAAVSHHQDSRGSRMLRIKPPQLHLYPINFELPHPEGKPIFVGREWLFKEVEMVSSCKSNKNLYSNSFYNTHSTSQIFSKVILPFKNGYDISMQLDVEL